MLERLTSRCLLTPDDVTPSRDDFKVVGVFNPGAVKLGDTTYLLARVAEVPVEERDDACASPVHVPGQGIHIDWLNCDEWPLRDPRIAYHKNSNILRLTFISHLRVYTLKDGEDKPTDTGVSFMPETPYEAYGVEDPRITPIGDTCYFTYVGASDHGVVTCLASTKDFKHFERHGTIFCPENKDVLLFPEQIGGAYFALHRPNGSSKFTLPEMWTAASPDLIHWGQHHRLIGGSGTWDSGRIGGGTPPIRTERGWLHIFHGSRKPQPGEKVGAYCGAALLLDEDDPTMVISRGSQPFVEPVEPFETKGFVDNVVFPTGIVEQGDELLMYCGAADENVSVVGVSKSALLDTLD